MYIYMIMYSETTLKLLRNYFETTSKLLRNYFETTSKLLRKYFKFRVVSKETPSKVL